MADPKDGPGGGEAKEREAAAPPEPEASVAPSAGGEGGTAEHGASAEIGSHGEPGASVAEDTRGEARPGAEDHSAADSEGTPGESEDRPPDPNGKAGAQPPDGGTAEASSAASSSSGPPSTAEGGHGGAPRLPERAWGRPLARVDAAWTKWEYGLATVVLLLELLALTLWVALRGLSTGWDPTAAVPNKAGYVFRGVTGAVVLGSVAWWALRKQPEKTRALGTTAMVIVGFFARSLWANAGTVWASNLLNWYQTASTLTLLGGLRGVGTRLTMLLVLLGGSLATAAGKHITIDLVTRYLKPRHRLVATITGWLGASVICFVASWGFLDQIAIESFEAKKDARFREKVGAITHEVSELGFAVRKQIKLDFMTLPQVLEGKPYANWLTGKAWNEFVDREGFAERFGAEQAASVKLPEDATKSPIVVIPGKGEPKAKLVHVANLSFPIGLFIIAVRFLLLALLTLSGQRSFDPEGHLDVGLKPRGHAAEPPPPDDPPEDPPVGEPRTKEAQS